MILRNPIFLICLGVVSCLLLCILNAIFNESAQDVINQISFLFILLCVIAVFLAFRDRTNWKTKATAVFFLVGTGCLAVWGSIREYSSRTDSNNATAQKIENYNQWLKEQGQKTDKSKK